MAQFLSTPPPRPPPMRRRSRHVVTKNVRPCVRRPRPTGLFSWALTAPAQQTLMVLNSDGRGGNGYRLPNEADPESATTPSDVWWKGLRRSRPNTG